MLSKRPAIFRGRMTDEQWAISGTKAIATPVLWFGSDGAAPVAKIVPELAQLAETVVDAETASKTCGWA